MVKFASIFVATAILSIPALAMPVKQYERDLAENTLYGRDIFSYEGALTARDDLDDLYGRELHFDEDLEAREPVNPAIITHVFHFLHKAHKHAHHASGLLSNGNQDNDRRGFEDEDILGRELDFDEDLEAREPLDHATLDYVPSHETTIRNYRERGVNRRRRTTVK
ncbi:hypothetical protein CVT26_004305 [Gymnopilus dilepis]|uniref:Uncharacterized protein n=1 Tax=Gymnopilus dilepis TaxID=231916 RepID=A0A409WPR0_9AGAR|nr:hypothetical protein CVT26_004305 [Gymnopilus dilepis]